MDGLDRGAQRGRVSVVAQVRRDVGGFVRVCRDRAVLHTYATPAALGLDPSKRCLGLGEANAEPRGMGHLIEPIRQCLRADLHRLEENRVTRVHHAPTLARMAARALLLDLDRTLVDLQSFTDYAAALRDVQQLTGEWVTAEVPETDWDQPTMACMSVLHSLLGDPRWQDVSDAIAVHERAAIPQSVVMPTVLESRETLRQVPVAIVTLLAPELVADVLAAHGIDVGERAGAEVDVVVGRASHVRPKPEADGLLAACAALGVAPADAVMIGDSSWDAEAAERAGVPFIGVPSSPGGLDGVVHQEPTFADAVAAAIAS